MTKCTFCGKEEYAFKGLHLIKNDGSIAYFCSSKCRFNALKLKRDKRKVRWTSAFKHKGKEIAGVEAVKAVEGSAESIGKGSEAAAESVESGKAEEKAGKK